MPRKGLFGYNSRTHPRMLEARERMDYALKLRLMGKGFQEIADAGFPLDENGQPLCDKNGFPLGRLYATRGAAHKAVCRALQLMREEKSAVLAELVAKQEQAEFEMAEERQTALERLDMVLVPNMQKVMAGDIGAGNNVAKIIKLRAEILGYSPAMNYRKHSQPKQSEGVGLPYYIARRKERDKQIEENNRQREAAL